MVVTIIVCAWLAVCIVELVAFLRTARADRDDEA